MNVRTAVCILATAAIDVSTFPEVTSAFQGQVHRGQDKFAL